MRRIVKILGLAMVLAAILVVALAGSVFAGNGDCDQSQAQDNLQLQDGSGDNCQNLDCVPVGDEYKYGNGGSGDYGKYCNNIVTD
jgi:hypothetical protein